MNAPIVGILLAAGRSRRFGGDKLLHPLADGTPLVVASARRLQAALTRTLAVVADGEGEVARLLRAEGMPVVVNARAHRGMGGSIACGVQAARDAAGWLIALGDMPYVAPALVRQLAARLAAGADLVAPRCQGRRGHPVGFAARHAPALSRLCDDEGARGLLTTDGASLVTVETDNPGVLMDIDTPEALRAVPVGGGGPARVQG